MSQKIKVFKADGGSAGTRQLPTEIFDTQTNVALIHQVIVAQQAAARFGNHKTKTRSEVSGGGVKPYRQKGTGRARQGSIRAPQFVGGGIVHGPTPRDYSQRTPKKMKLAALRGALSDRARNSRVHIVDSLINDEKPSTKSARIALEKIVVGRRTLLVVTRDEENIALSVRNLSNVHVLPADQLNTYDVMTSDDVVFTAAAFDAFVAGAPTGKSTVAVASSSEVDTDV